jgi:hypothetical protein
MNRIDDSIWLDGNLKKKNNLLPPLIENGRQNSFCRAAASQSQTPHQAARALAIIVLAAWEEYLIN